MTTERGGDDQDPNAPIDRNDDIARTNKVRDIQEKFNVYIQEEWFVY